MLVNQYPDRNYDSKTMDLINCMRRNFNLRKLSNAWNDEYVF